MHNLLTNKESRQLICRVNQLAGFYKGETLIVNGSNFQRTNPSLLNQFWQIK